MKYNEDRDSLKDVPIFTLPPPPRFDAAASAAARPVEPLAEKEISVEPLVEPKIFSIDQQTLEIVGIDGHRRSCQRRRW